jgi:MtrB/PioB family decaheme-associated outer membrane protein
MNARKNLAVSALTLAIQAALAAMAAAPMIAMADTAADVAALTHPTSAVEIGAADVSNSSAKFGEYNGLNKSGLYGIANFNVRGGNAYGMGAGTLRWSAFGSDLGTTARELGGNFADQGSWSLGLKFDELRHNITDTYQTPFVGSMGGNIFTVPPGFGIINSTAVTNSNNQAVGTRNLTAAQLATFRQMDIATTRKNSTFNAGYDISDRWNVRFDYNHLEQTGAKLIAGSSSAATTGAGAAGSWAKEAMVILPNPTKYKTDTFNLATNWTGAQSYLTASYYGSFFRDGYDRLFWENPIGLGSNTTGALTTTLAGGYQPNMLSTMPSNDFNQVNLTGGYNIRPTTKLVGGISYGRNTQNDPFLLDPGIMQPGGTPQTSLNGLVLTKHADLKLTDVSYKDLALTAAFKFNERHNETPSNVYKMLDLGGGQRLEINTPFSNRRTELELAGDYRLAKGQNVRVFADREEIKRWCDNVAGASTPPTSAPGALPNSAPSPAGANCAIVPKSAEDKIGVTYRFKPSSDLNLNAGYTHSNRKADVDHNALTALNDQATPNLTGIVNASDYKGFLAFFSASRRQDQLKAGANWQAAERLNLSASARYSGETYPDSVLGVQSGHSASLNLDGTFAYSDKASVSLYATAQQRSRSMMSGASGNGATDNAISYANLVAPTNIWSNRLDDRDQTIGVTARQKGLMGGKLEITADLSVTAGRTKYHTEVPYLATCATPAVLSCGDTPQIYSRTEIFKLKGNYQIDKQSSVNVGYWFQKLVSNDYFFNAYQTGFTPSTLLPTNQQAPSYKVHVITLSYLYTF